MFNWSGIHPNIVVQLGLPLLLISITGCVDRSGTSSQIDDARITATIEGVEIAKPEFEGCSVGQQHDQLLRILSDRESLDLSRPQIVVAFFAPGASDSRGGVRVHWIADEPHGTGIRLSSSNESLDLAISSKHQEWNRADAEQVVIYGVTFFVDPDSHEWEFLHRASSMGSLNVELLVEGQVVSNRFPVAHYQRTE